MPVDIGSVNITFCATLVDEWVRCGLTDAVICPGSRSTPMALALAEDGRVRIQVHHDERSGSFMAVGLARATNRPVVVLATSGTATVQFHAAVVEADLDRVPLLVLTADRPPELHGIGAPQTINQVELYGTSVRSFIDAGPPDPERAGEWRALARDAFVSATAAVPGPVQLNLPFREPLVGVRLDLPEPLELDAMSHRTAASQGDFVESEIANEVEDDTFEDLADLVNGRAGVLIVGGGIDDTAVVLELAETLGWPVLADQRSGCRVLHPNVIAHSDAIMRMPSRLLDVELIIRIGAPHASKVLSQWLASTDADQVLVDPDGVWRDPEGRSQTRIAQRASEFARALLDQQVVGADLSWSAQWRRVDDAVEAAIAAALDGQSIATEPGVARAALAAVPEGGALVVSSSMPIRDLEWFGARRSGVVVHANRGANGIDGVVSTAVGVAASGVPTVLLIGDVALLHDTNGLLGLEARGLDLCIVVIDNDGGGIFSFLPQRTSLEATRFEQLFGTPHGVNITGLANAHGLGVLEATDDDAVFAAVGATLATGGAHVVLVRTNRDSNVELHDHLHTVTAAAITDALRGE